MPLTSHCLCTAVQYTVDIDAPLLTGYDHYDDCQRQSALPTNEFSIKGKVKRWVGQSQSGKTVYRIFCPTCGSPIAHESDANAAVSFLKAGTLDVEIKKALKPNAETFTARKLPFCEEQLARKFEYMPR